MVVAATVAAAAYIPYVTSKFVLDKIKPERDNRIYAGLITASMWGIGFSGYSAYEQNLEQQRNLYPAVIVTMDSNSNLHVGKNPNSASATQLAQKSCPDFLGCTVIASIPAGERACIAFAPDTGSSESLYSKRYYIDVFKDATDKLSTSKAYCGLIDTLTQSSDTCNIGEIKYICNSTEMDSIVQKLESENTQMDQEISAARNSSIDVENPETIKPKSPHVTIQGLSYFITNADMKAYTGDNILAGVIEKGSCVYTSTPYPGIDQNYEIVVDSTAGKNNFWVHKSYLENTSLYEVENCKAKVTFDSSQAGKIRSLKVDTAFSDLRTVKGEHFRVAAHTTGMLQGSHPKQTVFHTVLKDSCLMLFSDGQSSNGYARMAGYDDKADKLVFGYVKQADLVKVTNQMKDEDCVVNLAVEPQKQAEQPSSLTGTFELESDRYYIVIADRLNLRKGPGTEHKVTGTLMGGSCVKSDGAEYSSGGFARVFADTTDKRFQRGFVSEKYLAPAPESTNDNNCFTVWAPN